MSVNWQTVADWIDTEGTIASYIMSSREGGVVRRRKSYIAISQTDKEPLEKLCEFMRGEGITCSIYRLREGREFELKIIRVKDVEKVVNTIEPYILTGRKKAQIERFRRFRAEIGTPIDTSSFLKAAAVV